MGIATFRSLKQNTEPTGKIIKLGYGKIKILAGIHHSPDTENEKLISEDRPFRLFGGWPGALIAQQTLRHKSRKEEFQWVYKFTVILNVAVTAWLLTPRGPERTLEFLEKVFK